MSAVIVRYVLKEDRLDEHLALIDAVFTHLRDAEPEGVHYAAFKSADGTAFTHIGVYDSDEALTAASQNEAFQAFVADIGDRCEVPPEGVPQTLVDGFGAFGS